MIIGFGTGRCGTKGLGELLGVPHETYVLPWVPDDVEFLRALSLVHKGDVGFYWLNYLEGLICRDLDLKAVCLKRDREAVVASFMRSSGPWNFWCRRGGRYWDDDVCFDAPAWPSYDLPKEDALRAYWEDYYWVAHDLEGRYPDVVRVFPVEVLDEPGEILCFIYGS